MLLVSPEDFINDTQSTLANIARLKA
jgi:hypothetical protein